MTSRRHSSRLSGYILLETVVATGLLVAGLAVIGAKVQDAERSVWAMRRDMRALRLAERHFAELDLGLIELDSVDDEQEGDFGPRDPDFGWLLTIEDTAIKEMFLLRLDVLFHRRDDEYREDEFNFDEAETIQTVYAMRVAPKPINFAVDFGLTEDELTELNEKLIELGIPELDPDAFDPAVFGKLDFDELLESMPVLLEAFGMDITQLMGSLPPGLLDQIRDSGLLDEDTQEQLFGSPDDGGSP